MEIDVRIHKVNLKLYFYWEYTNYFIKIKQQNSNKNEDEIFQIQCWSIKRIQKATSFETKGEFWTNGPNGDFDSLLGEFFDN